MAEKMKAQVFYEAKKMMLEEIPMPRVSDNDVLVKVKNVGICGSDIAYYYGLSPVNTKNGKGPIVLGHEFTGQVVEVGAIPKSRGLFSVGDRVVVNPVQPCNACYDCAAGNTHICANVQILGVSTNGAMADFCTSHYTGLFKLPDSLGFEAGALLEPLACAVNGMARLDIQPGQFVAIFGPGPIGIMMVELAKNAFGAGTVALIGTRDYRLQVGKDAGADFVFNDADPKSAFFVSNLGEAMRSATGGKLADRVIVPTGSSSAFSKAVEIGGNCSIIVQFGLPDADAEIRVPALSFHVMDKQIRSAWLAPGMWPTTIRCAEQKLVDLEGLITHRTTLADASKAIVGLKERKDDPMKIEIVV